MEITGKWRQFQMAQAHEWRKFRHGVLIGLFVLFAGPFSVRAAVPAEVRSWLAAQTNLQTWTADFVQTRSLKTLAQPLVSTGQVWFAAPNRFRWEIKAPAPTIAVRGAEEMLVIYPRLKRVEKYPLNGENLGQWKDTLALLEAGFPRSEADLERQFNITSISSTNEVTTVVLQPKSSAARRMMPHMRISFSATNHLLAATELEFGDGSTMRNDFRNTVVNPSIEPATFAPRISPEFKVSEPLKARR